jgi:hypothetical protein
MIGIESGCSPRPGALLFPGIYLIKVSFSLSGAVFWTLMRYIRQYNKDPKTVKWKYFDPSRRITPESAVTVH